MVSVVLQYITCGYRKWRGAEGEDDVLVGEDRASSKSGRSGDKTRTELNPWSVRERYASRHELVRDSGLWESGSLHHERYKAHRNGRA